MQNNKELILNDNKYSLLPRIGDFPNGIPIHPDESKNLYIQNGGGSCWIYHAIDPNQRRVLIKEYRDLFEESGIGEARKSHDIITAAIDAYRKGAGEYHPIDIQVVTDSDGTVYQLFRDTNADVLCLDASSSTDLLRLLESYVGFLKGLNCLHSVQILLKDVKPENIVRLSGNPGEAFYQPIDFGEALHITEDSSLNDTDSTGNWYCQKDIDALENMRLMEPSNYKKFVFSLDCSAAARVLYYMLTGLSESIPTTKERLKEGLENALKIKETMYGVYTALVEFCYKAFCEQNITKRFLSCSDMIRELQAILDVMNCNFSTKEARNIYFIDQMHEIQKESFAKTKIKKISKMYSVLDVESNFGTEDFDIKEFNKRYSLEIEKNNEITLKRITFNYLLFSFASIIIGLIALIVGIIDSIPRNVALHQGILKPQTYITFISISVVLIIVSHFLIDFIQDHGRAPRFIYVIKFRKNFKAANKQIVYQKQKLKKSKLPTAMTSINVLSVLTLIAFLILNRSVFVGGILAATPVRAWFIATITANIISLCIMLWSWHKQHSKKHSIDSKIGDVVAFVPIILISLVFFIVGIIIYTMFWSEWSLHYISNIMYGLSIVLAVWLIVGCCFWDKLVFIRNISIALLVSCITIGTLYCTMLGQVGLNTEIVSSDGRYYLISTNSYEEKSIGPLNYDSETIVLPHVIESHAITKTIPVMQFSNHSNTHTIVIESGFLAIGEGSFEVCSSLKEITIPKTVTAIEDSAFLNCNMLTSVFYDGTMEEWHQISIGIQNDVLYDANIYCSDGIISP